MLSWVPIENTEQSNTFGNVTQVEITLDTSKLKLPYHHSTKTTLLHSELGAKNCQRRCQEIRKQIGFQILHAHFCHLQFPPKKSVKFVERIFLGLTFKPLLSLTRWSWHNSCLFRFSCAHGSLPSIRSLRENSSIILVNKSEKIKFAVSVIYCKSHNDTNFVQKSWQRISLKNRFVDLCCTTPDKLKKLLLHFCEPFEFTNLIDPTSNKFSSVFLDRKADQSDQRLESTSQNQLVYREDQCWQLKLFIRKTLNDVHHTFCKRCEN